jgi:hypothetical protein
MRPHDRRRPIPADELGAAIRRVPYDEPDPALTHRIMAGLQPRRLGWLARLVRTARTPFRFSVTPLGALTAALVVFVVGGILFRQMTGPAVPPGADALYPTGVPVVFQLNDPGAHSVAVMGTFNDWNPRGYEMKRDPATGQWMLKIRLQPGQHDYVFWVDNAKVVPDPRADLNQDDGFGTVNSVIFIKGNHDQAI